MTDTNPWPERINPLAYPACIRIQLPPHGYAAYILNLDQRAGFVSEQVMAPTEEQEQAMAEPEPEVETVTVDAPKIIMPGDHVPKIVVPRLGVR